MIPLLKSRQSDIGYLLPWCFITFNDEIKGIPFVPDLIDEESHALANTMILMFGSLGQLAGNGLITVMNIEHYNINYTHVYYFIGALNILVGILTSIFIKDVIRSIDFILERLTDRKGNSIGKVLGETAKLISNEPYITFSIIGSALTFMVKLACSYLIP